MANAIEILNTIRANASALYQSRIPVATRGNLDKIAAEMGKYQATQNEFLNLLVNRIAMVIVNNKMINNPLSMLKKGKVPMGKDIEELFVNPAVATEYNLKSEELLKVVTPDVKALYYGINRQDKYRVTIAQPTLLQAFVNDGDMNSLINQIVNSLYSGDNFDEFIITKQLVADAVTKENVVIKNLGFNPAEMTKDNATNLIKNLRSDSLLLTFPSSNFNKYNKVKPVGDTGKDVVTFTPVEEQVLLIDSLVYSNINVDVLATAFNLDKADFIGRVIPVDNFNGAPIIGMLCDVAWFRIYDNYKNTTDMFNGDTLNYHYWLHHWQTLQYSMFANAIAYTYTPTEG